MKGNTLSLLIAVVSITVASFAIAQDAPKEMSKGHNMPVFSDIDLNDDGNIVAEEFYQARSKRMAERAAAGGKMKNAANAPSFEDIDTDGDSKVSPEEFSKHQAEQISKRQHNRRGQANQ